MKSRQLDFEAIPDGTYLNSGRAAQLGMTINRFCYDLRHPSNREAFLEDREALMDRYDWLGMVRRGANVFPLRSSRRASARRWRSGCRRKAAPTAASNIWRRARPLERADHGTDHRRHGLAARTLDRRADRRGQVG